MRCLGIFAKVQCAHEGNEVLDRRWSMNNGDVVMSLISPFYNKNYHVYFDNFFASPKLMDDLLSEGTYACSTVRINRKGLPPCSLTKLKRAGETLTSQKGNLLYTKWHDKRDVNILSTNIDPLPPPVVKERRRTEWGSRGSGEAILRRTIQQIHGWS